MWNAWRVRLKCHQEIKITCSYENVVVLFVVSAKKNLQQWEMITEDNEQEKTKD